MFILNKINTVNKHLGVNYKKQYISSNQKHMAHIPDEHRNGCEKKVSATNRHIMLTI